MSVAVAPVRAATRREWLTEKATVAKRYNTYAHTWVHRQIARMERCGEIPANMSLEKFENLRCGLLRKVPEYDDATGRAKKSAKEPLS